MKTSRSTPCVLLLSGLASLLAIGCTEKQPDANAHNLSQPVNNAPVGTAAGAARQAPTAPQTLVPAQTVAALGPPGDASDFSDISDCTFDDRARFFAGLTRLKDKVDRQVSALNSKRATMPGKVDTNDWDFAMKEMESSRTYLKALCDEVRNATPEIWDQEKENIRRAWLRAQEAYDKVKASTTI